MKRNRANSVYSQKKFADIDNNKENMYDSNAISEELSYRTKMNINHHHLLNHSYKNQSSKQLQAASSSTAISFTDNQFQDLYDKLKSDFTKLMIDFQKEQMECNNLKSQSKLDQKKLNEQDRIVAEQQQELVTLNNEIQLQISQNHVLRQYLKEQEDQFSKIATENSNLVQESQTTRPNSLKNKSYSSIIQQNEMKYEQLNENKEYLERQNEQLQQQISRYQNQIKDLQEQNKHVKMQFCQLENHTQQLQRNAKQLELESSQNKINESLLQKSYSKLEEDYREMQNINVNLQDHNKQLEILILKLEDKIKIMEQQCNNTMFWEQKANELESNQYKLQEDQKKKTSNIKEMESYLQKLKSQFKEERDKLQNELKSYKKEIQLHREKTESLNQNMSAVQKDYIQLKSQTKNYQSQQELIRNLKDTVMSIEGSLSREVQQHEEKLKQIKELEIELEETRQVNKQKQDKIIKLEEQLTELNQRQLLPISDTLNPIKEQQINSFSSSNLNETQQNYNSCNSNRNIKAIEPYENQWEMHEKVRRLEQTIFDLKGQIRQQSNTQQNESTSFFQPYAPQYSIPKSQSITNNSPHRKNYLSNQYTSNSNHNIHSHQNNSFNMSRPTIELDRNHSQNNSFHYRKNSNDSQSFLGSISSGFNTNKNKSSQMENLQRKYDEIKSRAIKNNQ